MRLRNIPAFALVVFALAAPAQAKRPMTFEDMMQMRRLGETEVSPDGKWLLYSVTDVDLGKNTRIPKLWIQPVDSTKGGEPEILEGTEAGRLRVQALAGRPAPALSLQPLGNSADLAGRLRPRHRLHQQSPQLDDQHFKPYRRCRTAQQRHAQPAELRPRRGQCSLGSGRQEHPLYPPRSIPTAPP